MYGLYFCSLFSNNPYVEIWNGKQLMLCAFQVFKFAGQWRKLWGCESSDLNNLGGIVIDKLCLPISLS